MKKTKIYGKAELLPCGMIHGESSMAAADKKLKDDFAVLWRVVAFLHVINRHLFFPYQLVDFASIPCQIRLAVGECVCFWNFAAATGDKLNSHFHHQRFRIEFHWELWPSQFNFKLLVRLLATHFKLRQFHFDKSCFLLWCEWNSHGTRLIADSTFQIGFGFFTFAPFTGWLDFNQTERSNTYKVKCWMQNPVVFLAKKPDGNIHFIRFWLPFSCDYQHTNFANKTDLWEGVLYLLYI